MKLHYIPIAIVVVSMIALGCISFISDMGSNYGTSADFTGLNKTRDRLDQQQARSQAMSDNITAMQLDAETSNFFNIPYKMIKVGWLAAKNMFSSWATVGTMVTETGEELGNSGIPLPSWLIPSIITIILFILGAMIIYALFKRLET